MPKTCFVISPIGVEGSETRKRADDAFEGIIKPAVEPLGYKPVRADHLKSPGKITDQVIEIITEAPLVIADLTDLNANVFYELSLRHISEKPVVHIIHKDQIAKIINIDAQFRDLTHVRMTETDSCPAGGHPRTDGSRSR